MTTECVASIRNLTNATIVTSVISISYIVASQSDFTTMLAAEDEFQMTVPRFITTDDDDFYRWILRVKAALCGRKIPDSPTGD